MAKARDERRLGPWMAQMPKRVDCHDQGVEVPLLFHEIEQCIAALFWKGAASPRPELP